MAKNKKPKFLEAETSDLLALLKETLSGDEVDDKAVGKALKIADELISRQPDEEAPISVDEALRSAADIMTGALNKVKDAYENEISMMEDSDESDEPEEEIEEEETPKKSKKAKKEKASKKSKKKEEPEDEEDDDEDEDEESPDPVEEDDDEDEEDYSDWSLKDLKKECRTRGIKVTKGMAKADMVKALEADDKE